jgi:DNA replication protein DnaC
MSPKSKVSHILWADRLTHHVNNLEMNGESYRLGQSKARQNKP